jgi:cytochrome c oxidase assembly protein subunit 15
MGIHGVIEFGNRMLTYVLIGSVGAAIIAARCRKPWRRSLTRLGWAQFWIVLSNAVLGGITVLTGLNPYSVALHLLSAMSLIWVAVLMWERSKEGDDEPVWAVPRPVVHLSYVLVAVAGLLNAAGTLVTGSGKHSGDSSDVARMPFDYDRITQFHADFAFVMVGLTLAMIFVLRAVGGPALGRARSMELLAMLVLQGAVGFVQFFTGSPEWLVNIHLLLSALMWVSVLRIPLALRVRPGAEPDPSPETAGEAGLLATA